MKLVRIRTDNISLKYDEKNSKHLIECYAEGSFKLPLNLALEFSEALEQLVKDIEG